MNHEEKVAFIRSRIGDFPNFPKEGIVFRDLFTALTDGAVCKALQELMIDYVRTNHPDVEAIVGLESRGFLFCLSIAAELGVGCIPVRKKGKLPGDVVSYSYDLEYGSDTFEIQRQSFKKPGLKCLVVDDLLATGGSMEAAMKLLQKCGAEVVGFVPVIELMDLKGRDKMRGIPVHSFIQY